MKPLCFIILIICFSGCSNDRTHGWIDYERLLNREAKDWLTIGGNSMMQHYSPLNQINKGNVSSLGYAWEYDASTIIGNVPR